MANANGKTHPQLNRLDRLIGYFNPAAGAKRFQFRNYYQRLYEGANSSSTRIGRYGTPQDAARELPKYDRQTMVDRSRYLSANLGFIRGAKRDLKRYSVGAKGLYPESQSTNQEWANSVEDLYQQWDKMADATGRFTFGEMHRMAVDRMFDDGDCGLVYVRDSKKLPQFQFIEGHQIEDDGTFPDSIDGVIIDPTTYNPSGYRIRVKTKDGSIKSETVEAANFLHVYDPERYTGTRGIPWLCSGINNALDIFDIVGYEKHFLHNASSKSLIETNDTGSPDQAASYLNDRPLPTDSTQTDPSVKEEKLESGTIVYHRAGADHDLKAFQFDRPTRAFLDAMDWLEGDVYLGIDLPVTWKNLFKEGGATLRAALGKAQRRFDEIQAIIEQRICFRVWNYLTFEAARLGQTPPRPADWYKVLWYGPAKCSVDAGRDSKANIEDIKMGLRTYAEDYGERGKSSRDGLRKVATEAAGITTLAAEVGEDRENIVQRYLQRETIAAGTSPME